MQTVSLIHSLSNMGEIGMRDTGDVMIFLTQQGWYGDRW